MQTTPIWLPAGSTNYQGDLVVRGIGTVAELQSADLIQPASVVASAGGRFVAGGDLVWPSLALENAGQMRLDGTHQVLAPLVINRGTAEVNGVLSAPDVVLTNAGVLTHTAATTTNEYRLELAVSNTLSISSNSAINVSGKGYLPGRTYPNTTTGASTGYSGGSYGGLGGANSGVPNPVYGDSKNPNEPGSGGVAGAGGGLLRIETGTLDLQGQILASGTDSSGGRGSGGGIRLDVDRLAGPGQLIAKGGNSSNGNGGGGGGRVAIYYQELAGFSVAGNVSVSGGSGNPAGSAGTIYATNVARVQLSMFAPTGHVNSSVSNLTLTFATPLDDATLGLEDMSLTGPAGAVSLSDLVKLSTYTYQVGLTAPAEDDGLYTFILGTNILTESGNPPDGPSTNRFTIDRTAPAVPVLTSHLAAPATNHVRTTTPTLAGSREADSAIWINGVQRAGLGEGTWSWGLSLNQGLNVVSYWAVDRAGNVSATNQALFFVDSVAPAVAAMQPTNGSLANVAPESVRLWFAEAGSGVDEVRSERYFQRSGITIPGTWTWETNGLTYTPAEGLMDGTYAVSVRLYDLAGNTGTLYQAGFTVDTEAPSAPVVNPVASPTILASQQVAGTKEANTLVRLNGTQVVALGAATNWSHAVSLVPGANPLSYTAVDAAGNESAATAVEIVYDNEAPGPVAVTAMVAGVGTQIALGWADYDELANGGDIASYAIYQGDDSFNHVAQATEIGTRSAGQKSFIVSNLVRGATKHYAVMARDLTGLADSNVTSVGFAPVDTVAPANPSNLAFDCYRSNLVVKWAAPADPDGDLAGYRVYINDTTNTAAGLSWDAGGGLQAATGYPVRVASVDATGNESAGTNGMGVTLLDHPTNVVAVPYSGLVDLTWSATAPTQYVKEYRVYAGPAPFSGIGGMTAQVATVATMAAVTGLVNDVPYWFAVAAVNLSGGTDSNVATVMATPAADSVGPEIYAFQFAGVAVSNGMVLQQPGTFTVQAWDRAGVTGAELRINGTNYPMAAGGGTNFSWFWNLAAETDGACAVELRVTDAFDNPTTRTNVVEIALAPPANAPAISAPTNGAWLNSLEISVAGLADRGAVSVAIYGDGQALASGVADANGAFTVPIALADGTNRLQAAAANRAGEGPVSGVVTVRVDRTIPAAPMVTNFAPAPATNRIRTTTPTLAGTREADTAVWIDGAERVSPGTGNWSFSLSLSQGLDPVSVFARDRAGNVSETNQVLFFVDSIAPAVTAFAPANGALTNAAPTTIRLWFTETGSGVDEARSEWSLQKGGIPIPGTGTYGTNTLTFTPSGGLLDGTYAVSARLVDQSGNTGALYQAGFTVDTTPPAAPVVRPVTSPTINASQGVGGTREANTAVRLNGVQVVAAGSSTNWSHTAVLVPGANVLSYALKDAAGNESAATTVEIVYDNTAPDPVGIAADGRRNGLTVKLDWPAYDETANGGDILQYRVYRATAAFADIGVATQVGAVNAGVKTYVASNLARAATYHFAVVAVDQQNQFRTDVASVPVTTEDVVPPAEPESLSFDCFRSNLVVRWTAPADPDMDLAGYRVYFNGTTNAAAGLSWDAGGGLPAATGYPVRVASVDLTGNESAGTNGLGVTLLDHPTNVAVEVYSGVVDLQWSASMPTQYVKEYRVYGSTAPFEQVGGMSAAAISKTLNASVAGLADNRTYYLAVAAVNLSGGMDTNVATIDATPRPDTNGPTLTNLRFDDEPVTEGVVIRRPGTFRVNAWDRGGVSRVEFRMDGALLGTDANGTTNYAAFWNVAQTTNDGPHELELRAYDTRANATVWQTNVTVELAVPLAPALTQPANGKLVNKSQNWVAGTGAVYASSAVLYVNGEALTSTPLAVSSAGAFGGWILLPEGSNVLRAAAANRAGEGAQSAPVSVTVDLSIPSATIQLTASAKAGGAVQLSWVPVLNAKGYWIYRSTSPFTATSAATRLNAALYAGTYYQDVTPADGTYYYRVATVNQADTEGPLSPEAQATTDRTAPQVVSVGYSTTGAYSPIGPRYGRGNVTLSILLSEELQAAPFFSLNPIGGSPITPTLRRNATNALLYTGTIAVGEGTPCGTAYAVFSGWDVAGNRGTDIQSGGTVVLDACGPAMTGLQMTPGAPIQNDAGNPATIAVVAAFDAGDVPVGGPGLKWRLSQSQPDWTDLFVSPLTANSWSGSLMLPAAAGQTGESLEFAYRGVDDLGNTGTVIAAQSSFQVYQGDLPPLESPWGLTGEALPGGQVKLTWQAVENAIGYALYRGTASDNLSYLAATAGALEYQETVGNATNWYAVASLRSANGQVSTSAWSSAVRVVADDQAPAAPTDVELTLAGNGMYLTWTPPAETNVRYNVYRDGQCLESLAGKTPVVSNVPAAAALDRNPLAGTAYYVVSAKDAVGNESGPSACAYTNLALLPVSSLKVRVVGDNRPIVSWAHPARNEIDGFNLYLEDGSAPWLLGHFGSAAATYEDSGFTGQGIRQYRIAATDASGAEEVESIGRSVLLPALQCTLSPTSTLKKGVMNRLYYQVANLAGQAVENVQLKVQAAGRMHISQPFNLAAGSTGDVSVVVGGYTNLAAVAVLTNTLAAQTLEGEVEIASTASLATGEDKFVAEIANDELLRGVPGKVRFTLHNTSPEEIEIVMALNAGNSPEVRIKLETPEGMVLASGPARQSVGAQVVTIAGGVSVARIAAGESFTSGDIDLTIPTNAPQSVRLKLEIDKIHYHHGDGDHVEMSGLTTTRAVELFETIYWAAVTNVTPSFSLVATNVLIQGHAVNRATGNPQMNAPVKVVVSLDGFERSYMVTSDTAGAWAQWFEPLPNESGLYKTWAVHPSLVAKPVQAQFVISSVWVTPAAINLTTRRNLAQVLPAYVTVSKGMTLTNLHLAYLQEDQPGGEFAPHVQVTTTQVVALAAGGQKTGLNFTVLAESEATNTATLVLRMVSVGCPEDGWGKITVNATIVEDPPQVPVLNWSPGYVYTGVAASNQVHTGLKLWNSGTTNLMGVTLAVKTTNGAAAPGWVILNTSPDLGTLVPNEERQVSLTFAPTGGVAESLHEFRLHITAANYPERQVALYAQVDNSGRGSALFKVTDIYTGTTNQLGGIVQGLQGARISLQRESGLTYETNRLTDVLGEAMIDGLPEGSYIYRVTAADHETSSGRIWVRPGVTTPTDVTLKNILVTVEWSVREITLEDRYELILTTVYQTDVPVAVVVIDPVNVNLPTNMVPGDVFNGEFRFVNQGLIRAEHFQFWLPADDATYKFEKMCEVPDTIEPKQTIRIPYRVIRLSTAEAEGSGGGATCPKSYKGGCSSDSKCINGAVFANKTDLYITAPVPCPDSVTGSIQSPGSVPGQEVWSVTSGGTSPIIGNPNNQDIATIPGTTQTAFDTPIGESCAPDPCDSDSDPCCRFRGAEKTKSWIQATMGYYADERTDIWVKTAAGRIGVKREFLQNAWLFREPHGNYAFAWATGMQMFSPLIDGGGASGGGASASQTIPLLDSNASSGYARGPDAVTNRGVRTFYTYNESGMLTGVWDHFTNQVLWIEWEEVDGIIPWAIVKAVHDQAGRTVSYHYDHDNHLTEVVDVAGNSEHYEYNAMSQMQAKTLPGQPRVTISYDLYSRVKYVAGKSLDYYYSREKGGIYYLAAHTTSASSGGRGTTTTEKWLNAAGNVIRLAVNGEVTFDAEAPVAAEEIQYPLVTSNELGMVTRAEYADGTEESFEYNGPEYALTHYVDRRGLIATWQYDAEGNKVKETTAAGTAYQQEVTYDYDDLGRMLSKTIVGTGGLSNLTWQYTYDSAGNMLTAVDPWGDAISNSYNVMGLLLTTTEPGGGIWQYQYDARGLGVSVTDPLGRVASNRYDAAGRLVWSRDAAGREQTWVYDAAGRLTAVTNEWGETARYEYDADGYWMRYVGFDGQESAVGEYAFGQQDDVIVERNPDGLITNIIRPRSQIQYAYDVVGRMTEQIETEGNEARTNRWSYTLLGEINTWEDPLGRIRRFAYNTMGQMTNAVNPLGQVLEAEYASYGAPLSYMDENGHITQYAYDLTRREVRETKSDGSWHTRQSDRFNVVVEEADASGRTCQIAYDALGQVTGVVYFATNGMPEPIETTFEYDADGRLTRYAGGITVGIVNRNGSNRSVRTTVDFGAFTKTYEQQYDHDNRLIQLTLPDGLAISYVYGTNGKLARIDIPDEGSVNLREDDISREITFPGGVRQTWDFSDFGWMQTNQVFDAGNNLLWQSVYSYYPDGRLSAKQMGEDLQTFEYDAEGHLTNLTDSEYPESNESYTYDPAGNRLSSDGNTNTFWTTGAGNRLQTWPNGSYEFDAAGRVTRRVINGSVQKYTYDAAGRLAEVTDGEDQLIARYIYNAAGLRVAKITGTTTNWYLYGPDGLMAEYDDAGQPIREYLWKPGSLWMTGLLAMRQAGEWAYAASDLLDETILLAQSSGAPAWSGRTMGFTRIRIDVEAALTNHLRASGQYYDDETGLYYNGMRFYDPQTGRYMTPDPLGFVDGLNDYLFCANDPVNFVDPAGSSITAVGIGVVALKAYGASAAIKWLGRTFKGGTPGDGASPGDECEESRWDAATCTSDNFCSSTRAARKYAEMAQAVYGDKNQPAKKRVPLNVKGYELISANIQPGGYASALYKNIECGTCVLSFRGTDDFIKDPVYGWAQSLGIRTGQYQLAIEDAKKARTACPNGLTITGHSLGGGLAQIANQAVGGETVTFNPQGLAPQNRRKGGWFSRGDYRCIQNYQVGGEILTGTQSTPYVGLPHAKGFSIPIKPQISRWNMIDLHGMDQVIPALDWELNKYCNDYPEKGGCP
jgi:RHS repeat-associated protein